MVMFTIPETIRPVGILEDVVNPVDGAEAATTAQISFIEGLRAGSLPFQVLSLAEMRQNSGFTRLGSMRNDPASRDVLQTGFKALVLNPGVAPEGFPQFGLSSDWITAKAVTGLPAAG